MSVPADTAIVAAIVRALERHRKLADAAQQRSNANATKKTVADLKRECDRRHYEYFEQVYHNEEKRRDAFTTSLSFLLAILGIAGAIGTFYLRDVLEWIPTTPFSQDWSTQWFLALLVLDLLGLAIAAVFLVKALYNYSYEYLATPLEIRKYYLALLDFHGDSAAAETAFQEYLTEDYAICANKNDQNNLTRRKNQHRCVTTTVLLYATLAVTFVPFCAHKMRHREKAPLLIKWDNSTARIAVDQPISFDNTWPPVRFSLAPSANAKEAANPSSQAVRDTTETRETKAEPAPTSTGADLVRPKAKKIKKPRR